METQARCSAVVNCGQLVTLAGPARPRVRDELKELAIMPNGAMIIRNGVIEAIGTNAEVRSRIEEDSEIIDADGRVVLPGFVDAHTHAVFAGTRIDEYELRAAGATRKPNPSIAASFSATAIASSIRTPFAGWSTRHRCSSITKATCTAHA